ncbi:MAG TPA: peptidoglycan DD-metalloendopeptidase family protein [Rhodospirillales bacterium]|jgi:murein DD-endopeptidase MepM/ murein hydrolase activator NlpD|nr:peptidoglycan DD-metalloendopeptidase family protein [Rhodospirillales bacterium]
MRLKVIPIVAVIGAGLALAWHGFPAAAPPSGVGSFDPAIAMAPISLGNPTAAATLLTRRQGPPSEIRAGSGPYSFTLRAGPGDTLARLLVDAGISGQDAHAALATLNGHYDPRLIRPGQEITVTIQPNIAEDSAALSPGRFLGLSLVPNYNQEIIVGRLSGGGFKATKRQRLLRPSLHRLAGKIRYSLSTAGGKAGVPAAVLAELIRAYSWDVDFQRDIRPGDGFEVMFKRFHDADGNLVHNGAISYAALTLRGERHRIYLHTTAGGQRDYFNEKGESARKALMRTPIDGARLSSTFGKRRHPVLGYNKMHRGVDFAAPPGTPIYAAGRGSVIYAGRKGAYGNYIRLRHNGLYTTAYAHMRSFAKGMAKGRRVKQGQIIGYVGTTGRSTGPHLHYEILRQGRRVNPLKVKMPSGRKLKGRELKLFKAAKARIDRRYAATAAQPQS